MRRLAVIGICLMAAAAPAAPTPEQIAADIQADGPTVAVHRLWNSGMYDRILSGIAQGDGAWVALAPKLAAGADAAASEGLSVALARALPKNPAAVLSVLDTGSLSPGEVCGVPFVEGTMPDVGEYLRQTEAAVAGVDADALRTARAACLTALKSR